LAKCPRRVIEAQLPDSRQACRSGRRFGWPNAQIEAASPQLLADFLTSLLHDQLRQRLAAVNTLAAAKNRSIADGRTYVDAMLGFEVYSDHLFEALHAPVHAEHP
jgi:hypothetical protein